MGKREDASAPKPALPAPGDDPQVATPVTLDQLESASGVDDRIATVRGFTRDNPARAALAVRDMIKADAR